MKRACYGQPEGQLVTPEQFVERATSLYKERGVWAYCPACDEKVDLYGVHSPNVASRFDHKNLAPNADPLDDCILANRNGRFEGLEPDGWDEEAGKRLRAKFFEDENIQIAYGFCLQLCRKGNFPVKKFHQVIRRADKKKIWNYADIKLWVIPYIFLTLENFQQVERGSSPGYDFHFILEKPRGTTASALWRRPRDCRLKKVFTNSGFPVRASDNPFPISEQNFLEKAGDVSWVTDDLLRSLKAPA